MGLKWRQYTVPQCSILLRRQSSGPGAVDSAAQASFRRVMDSAAVSACCNVREHRFSHMDSVHVVAQLWLLCCPISFLLQVTFNNKPSATSQSEKKMCYCVVRRL